MNSSVISGLIGGIASILICSYVSSKIRNSKNKGELKFGTLLVVLGWCCSAIVVLCTFGFLYQGNVLTNKSDLYSLISLDLGFGAGVIWSFLEYFKTTGSYDSNGIIFSTPWSGRIEEKWSGLVSVKYQPMMGWYVLKFKSGKKIRISILLTGHGGVLKILEELEYRF